MPTALEYQLAHRFDELCRRLNESFADRSTELTAEPWDLPLAYWAVPKDRRLPRALLGYSLRRIVETSFAKLRATPGIGIKKLATLIELLERVLAAGPDGRPSAPPSPSASPAVVVIATGGADFDPGAVSESQWAQWCEAVKRHGLANEPLGRFAVTLRDLAGVLWHTPLSAYTDLTLEELRGRKTHGEKRVRAVIEIFAAVQSLLGQQPSTHLSVRVVPGFAAPLEAWLLAAADREGFPPAGEVQRAFIDPLIEQLRHDAGETVAQLAADRLLATTGEFNVRAAAGELGLTRARVYQLLAEASAVLSVRWPEGGSLVHGLREKTRRTRVPGHGARLFVIAADLFYPRRGDVARPGDTGQSNTKQSDTRQSNTGQSNTGQSDSVGRAQRGENESDSEDQPIAASPGPPGQARSPRRKADHRSDSPRQAVKPGRDYCSGGLAASIDTSTCCPT